MIKKFSKHIYAILIFYFIWLVCIPLGFRFGVAPLLNKADKNIKIENLCLYTSIFPNLKFRANEIKLLNNDGSEAFKTTNPKLNIRILPVLLGKIHINSFESENISANFVLKDKLYLGEYPIEIPEKQIKSQIDRIKLNDLNLSLAENDNSHKLNGKNIYFKKKKKTLIFHSSAEVLSQGHESFAYFDVNIPNNKNYKKTKFNIIIKNFNLKPFSALAKSLTKDLKGYELDSLCGSINLKSNNKNLKSEIKDLEINFENKNFSMKFPSKLKINGDYRIGKNIIKINSLKANSERLHAQMSGKIKNFTTLKPNFDTEVTIEKSDIREGALLMPPVITPDINIPKLKEYPFYGNIIGDMRIRGDFPEPNIYGKIKVTDGILVKPIPNSKKGADIGIEFVGKKLNLDVNVPAGDNEVVTVDGDIEVYGDKFSHLNIKSTPSVSLETAEFVVNRLHEIFCFMVGPVPIMDIKGRGNIDIRVVGTKKNPHIWGDFNFKNANASFLEVKNLVLENADGNLHFDNQKAHFVNRTGTLHGQKATVDGTCTLFGDLDFNVTANNQNLNDLYNTLTTSPMLVDIQNIVPKISHIDGKSDFFLNLKGKLFDIKDLKINENVIPKGYIKLLGNSMVIEGMPVKGVNGIINYNKTDCDFDLKSVLSANSVTSVKGEIKNNIADLKIDAPRLLVNDFDKEELRFLDNLYIKLNAKYKGKINEIEIGKIDAVIDILGDNHPVKNLKIMSGKITLKNAGLNISNMSGAVRQNPFNMNLNVRNIDNKNLNLANSHISGNFNCKKFDLTTINYLIKSNILPKNIQKELNHLHFKTGNVGVFVKAFNSSLNGTVNLNNIEFDYLLGKTHIPFSFKDGQLNLKNNSVKIKQMVGYIDEMPLYINGQLDNMIRNPQYKLNINSKLIQQVFDKYWNASNIYPIKSTGNITYTVLAEGNKSHSRIKSVVNLDEKSNIYYMGATFGDDVPNKIFLDADIDNSKSLKINNFIYTKNVGAKPIPIISVKGAVKPIGKIYEFKNLYIKTENPADARLFNIIFKKPTIKKGTFTSDLKINGTSNHPKVLGQFNANELEMPYINTKVKEIAVKFEPNVIQTSTKGHVLDNYIKTSANIKNNLTPPYKINSAEIYIDNLDLNETINQLKQLELKGISSAIDANVDESSAYIIHSLLFDNVKVKAGNVQIKNIKTTDLEATCSLNEKMLVSVDSFKFNMASGEITGKLNFNLLNNFLKMDLNAKDVNANSLTYALFDIQNQIYGSLTGHIDFSCNATNDKTRLTTLNGSGTFNVTEGRMPKLGSLEYLLKAGNLIKGGITGLSMNGIIDIITPMKTGNFSSINGRIRIKDGVAKTIEINSIGKNLNLYMIGNLNLYTSIADMRIFGQLSRKASTILGAAGNLSLNTLFNKIPGISLDSDNQLVNDINKIPGIELSNTSSRKFMVEILGDIDGDDFVKSFKWVK